MSRPTLQTPYTGSLSELKKINTPSFYKGSAAKNNAEHLKRFHEYQLDNASKALKTKRDNVARSEAKKAPLIAFPLPPKDLARARAKTSRIHKYRKGRTVLPRINKQPKLFAVSEADEDEKHKTPDGMETGDYPPLSGGQRRKTQTNKRSRRRIGIRRRNGIRSRRGSKRN
jgi:hypothetical protein